MQIKGKKRKNWLTRAAKRVQQAIADLWHSPAMLRWRGYSLQRTITLHRYARGHVVLTDKPPVYYQYAGGTLAWERIDSEAGYYPELDLSILHDVNFDDTNYAAEPRQSGWSHWYIALRSTQHRAPTALTVLDVVIVVDVHADSLRVRYFEKVVAKINGENTHETKKS